MCPTKADYKQCKAKSVSETALETAFVHAINRLVVDKEKFLKTLHDNIEKVIANRKLATPDEIENEIIIRQNEILALAKSFNKTTEDYLRGEKLASEIENLRNELAMSHRLDESINLATFRMNEIATMLENTFDTFNSDLFIDLVDKILIREHSERTMKKLPPYKWLDKTRFTALFIFKCGIELEESLT